MTSSKSAYLFLLLAVQPGSPSTPPGLFVDHGELVLVTSDLTDPGAIDRRLASEIRADGVPPRWSVLDGSLRKPGEEARGVNVIGVSFSDGEGRLFTLFDSSGLVDLALADDPALARDELGTWRHFLKAARRAARALGPLETVSPGGVDVPEATLEALERLGLTMNRISMFVEELSARLDAGLQTPPAWVMTIESELRYLEQNASHLAPVLGEDGAPRFAALASEAAGFFGRLEDRLRSEDGESVREFVRSQIRAGLCTTCHETRTSDGGERWWDAVPSRKRALGLPRTPLRVGVDLPVAWGDDGKRSQGIADALRFALIIQSELDETR